MTGKGKARKRFDKKKQQKTEGGQKVKDITIREAQALHAKGYAIILASGEILRIEREEKEESILEKIKKFIRRKWK